MKKILSLALFALIAFQANAQFEKTLLWEISGNGLKKKSYVYGTFHVNEKISYHLTDAFYKHLLEADIVSNESNPDSWGELLDLYMNIRPQKKPKFYSNFYLKPVTKQDLMPLFMNYNLFNQMSSGVEGRQADYSENTVLDMFIYQTAKKYNKKAIGLEDAKKSFITMRKLESMAQTLDEEEENTEEDEEKKALLTKILKGKSIYNTLKDIYREKDIVMLDSLSKLSEKPEKHKVMIVDRNYDMVKSIDSLAHQGSLFSAVGAAHLGGKEGVLQLLINKGYTLTPIIGTLTKKGETDKKTIEEFFPNPKTKTQTTADKMIQTVDFDLDFSFDKIKGTLDLTNGGVLSMVRVPIHNYMQKKNEYFNHKSIDSLLYEFIPGEILEKKEIKGDSYIGYDVKNKSKAGNYQHYRFYVTPLEIVSFCFSGSGTYAKQYEQSIFEKLKIKDFKNSWERIYPLKGGFSILMPEFAVQYGNNEKSISDVTFEAYDPIEKSYYFLIENTSLDMEFMDDRTFQHQQIQNEFYMNQEMKETAQFDETTKEYTSTSENEHRKVKLKSIIQGNKFYLLGAVDASEPSSSKFFDSFTFKEFSNAESTVYNDTVGKYKIEIPKKINEQTILGIKNDNLGLMYRGKMGANEFESKEFESHTGNTVAVDITNYDRYFQVATMDSLKNEYSKSLKTLLDKKNYIQVDSDPLTSVWNNYFKEYEKTEVLGITFTHNNVLDCDVADALVSVKNSDQALKLRTFFMNNRRITLKTLVDRNYKNDDVFIEKSFSTFVPEKTDAKSILDDKIALFIEEASSESDSIRKIAFENLHTLSLKESDFERVTNFLDTFEFRDSDSDGKSTLYEKLGNIKLPKVASYLENKYKAQGTKTTEQLAILNALAAQKTETSYRLVLKLMDFDLPVSEDTYELNELFWNFNRNIETSKVLFPDIFQFYGIEEYNELIVRFCNAVLDKKLGSPKKIAAFQKLILTHSKLEYKRILNREEKKASVEENEDEIDYAAYEDEDENPNGDLINYLSLLSYMPKNSSVTDLMEKIKKLDSPEIQLEILKLEIKHNTATKESIKKRLENPKTKFNTILLLQDHHDFGLLNDITDDEIALAAMTYFDKLKENAKIQFLEKRKIKKGKHEAVFYFYQTQNTKDGKTVGNKSFNSMAFLIENGKIIPKAYYSPILEEIDEENTVEILIPAIMKETLNEDHPDCSFRKNRNRENQYNYEY
ncbi:TraB/GumN family protein [Flavobacterium sp. IMCC34852]|uniref:TraB/GumN family protein n=1 Tax=Flavobacterium rivulicola TaxID=2732161 RepID=A0A7Y3R876_9FLAO|nr:TraB/GumN family protein [Flavobacterium sp. IMCC34852]NNT71320.1 TraB/GumN family protein [Flavobacterium sp. IMCC34852]